MPADAARSNCVHTPTDYVPVDDQAVVAATEHKAYVSGDLKGRNALGVTPESAQNGTVLVEVEVGDVTGQCNGEQVVWLPETADLLVVDLGAEFVLADGCLWGDVPDFGCLVAGDGEDELAGGVPTEAVDAAGVGLLLGTGTGELEELVACFAVEDDQLKRGQTN